MTPANKESSMKLHTCSRCVMDETDPEISFDSQGVCNHCHRFDEVLSKQWKRDGLSELQGMIERIKAKQKNKKYDCIIGLSGGVDSSYALYKAVKEFGLRVLAVHVDAGWNSEIATNNIQKLIDTLGVDLQTITIPWEEMRDLQVAFLRSGVANCDTPQDHAFFASLYGFAVKSGARYVINGLNIATESTFPTAWEHSAMDSMQLLDIHRRFGKHPLNHFPVVSFWDYYFYYPYIARLRALPILNYMDYHKQKAIEFLQSEIGWQSYGAKHHESIWTRFFQNYFLPQKFGYDKRKPHLSSLILSGEMTREQALAELEKPLYDEELLKSDLEFILDKLELSPLEWEEIMQTPPRSYQEYANNHRLYELKKAYIDPWLTKYLPRV